MPVLLIGTGDVRGAGGDGFAQGSGILEVGAIGRAVEDGLIVLDVPEGARQVLNQAELAQRAGVVHFEIAGSRKYDGAAIGEHIPQQLRGIAGDIQRASGGDVDGPGNRTGVPGGRRSIEHGQTAGQRGRSVERAAHGVVAIQCAAGEGQVRNGAALEIWPERDGAAQQQKPGDGVAREGEAAARHLNVTRPGHYRRSVEGESSTRKIYRRTCGRVEVALNRAAVGEIQYAGQIAHRPGIVERDGDRGRARTRGFSHHAGVLKIRAIGSGIEQALA